MLDNSTKSAIISYKVNSTATVTEKKDYIMAKAATVLNHRIVTIKQATRLVLKAFNAQREGKLSPKVPMLWGPPGIGKSEMVQGLADSGALGKAVVIDIRLPLMEPTDIRGIPYYNPTENTMKWAPSEEFPTVEFAKNYDTVILFLDELNAAPQSVQAASYQLILNRRVGTYKLPENVRVIVAGNRDGDGGTTFRMPTPLKNRMVHFELAADYDSWVEWAMVNGVHSEVIGYISYAKGDLMKFDPRSPERAFPTPRSWTFVSDFLYDREIDDMDLMELVTGTIGEGTAQSFMAQRKHSKDIPLPEDVLSGKVTKLKTKEISAMYSLTVNLCRELQEESKKTGKKDAAKFSSMVDNFFRFMMDNFPADMTVLGARTALFNYELDVDPTKLKHFPEFHERFGKSVSKAINN